MKSWILMAAIVLPCAAQFDFTETGAAVGGSATPALVQQTSISTCANKVSSNTFTCVLGSTPSASNVLVFVGAAVFNPPASPFLTPTSTGASWTNIAAVLNPPNPSTWDTAEIWCATLSGTPGTTITITQTNNTFAVGNVSEWSGLTCTPDGTGANGAPGGSTSTMTAATISTTHASDVLFASVSHSTGGSINAGPTNSYVSFNLSDIEYNSAYFIASSTGSYFTQWSYTINVQYGVASAALKSR